MRLSHDKWYEGCKKNYRPIANSIYLISLWDTSNWDKKNNVLCIFLFLFQKNAFFYDSNYVTYYAPEALCLISEQNIFYVIKRVTLKTYNIRFMIFRYDLSVYEILLVELLTYILKLLVFKTLFEIPIFKLHISLFL